jgi:cell division protein FtsI (penicillin-binding protein 3)
MTSASPASHRSKAFAPAARRHSKRSIAGSAIVAIVLGSLAGTALGNPGDVPKEARSAAKRADIVDRNGQLLAASIAATSLYARPSAVVDPVSVARAIAQVLPNRNEQELARLLSAKSGLVRIHRYLPAGTHDALAALHISGLEFRQEEQRVYPGETRIGHVVGVTDADGAGISGIERSFNDALSTSSTPLKLSIDSRVQLAVREQLESAVGPLSAIGGTALVMDVRTGELLALVSLPDFASGDRDSISTPAGFNRATQGAYEIGGLGSIFTVALALERGAALSSTYDANTPIPIGRWTVHDAVPLSSDAALSDIFAKSSNVGLARMALATGADEQRKFLQRLGLTDRLPAEMPGAATPRFPTPWRDVNVMTIAYGMGFASTPVQVASAIGAMVNGGIYHPATLLVPPERDVPAGHRVISTNTSIELRGLMKAVVADGFGHEARAAGYAVGGIGGAAEKSDAHGKYMKHALLVSFAGVFPINDPRYLVLAMIDEPRCEKPCVSGQDYRGLAAPAVGLMISEIQPILGVPAESRHP